MLNGRVLSNCGMHLTFSLSHGEIQNNGNHPTPQNNKCIPRAQIVNTSFHFFTFQKGFAFLFQLFLPETRVKQTKLSTRRNKQNLLHSGETKYNYSIRYHLEYCNSKPSCSCMGEVVQLQPVTYWYKWKKVQLLSFICLVKMEFRPCKCFWKNVKINISIWATAHLPLPLP